MGEYVHSSHQGSGMVQGVVADVQMERFINNIHAIFPVQIYLCGLGWVGLRFATG